MSVTEFKYRNYTAGLFATLSRLLSKKVKYASLSRFKAHFEPRVVLSPTVHPAANEDLVETLERDHGGEERKWPPYLAKPMIQDKCPL